MAPVDPIDYQRCGDVVWHCKRSTRYFAFRCIICGKTAITFKEFKLHLESEHKEELFKVQIKDEETTLTIADDLQYEEFETEPKLEVELEEFNFDPLEKTDYDSPESSDNDSITSDGDSEEEEDDDDDDDDDNKKDPDYVLEEEQDVKANVKNSKAKNDSKAISSPAGTQDALNSSMTPNQKEAARKRMARRVSTKLTAKALEQLSHEQNHKFIELYKSCKACWDVDDLSFRSRRVRQQANDKLLQLCRTEMQLEMDLEQLTEFISRIRYVYTQEKQQELKCEREGVEYVPTCRYQKQMQFLEGHVIPFKCQVCNEVFNSCDSYKKHTADHDGTLPYECPVCQCKFHNISHCISHFRRHDRDAYIACDECGKGFATNQELKHHQRSHTGEKPYCCDVCGDTFRYASFFNQHKRRHEQRHIAKCHICGKGFYSSTVLNNHIKAHLNIRDKVCKVCQKTFTSTKYLRLHEEIHAEKKRYVCKICSKAFAQHAGLRGHMKSHGVTLLEISQANSKQPAEILYAKKKRKQEAEEEA